MPFKRVYYVGPFFDEMIRETRGLRTLNSAGSNRIYRIALSFSENSVPTTIVSPAASLWSGRKCREWAFPREYRKRNYLLAVFLPSINVPFVNLVFAALQQLLLFKRRRLSREHLIIIYNFNVAQAILAAYIRLTSNAKIIANIEDVSVPKLVDWLPGSRARPFQQALYFFCMKAVARLSHGYMVPTKRFLSNLPYKSHTIVITGCISSPPPQIKVSNRCVTILFAGKLEVEDGVFTLFDIIDELADKIEADTFEVHVCGTGSQSQAISKRASEEKYHRVNFHGFLSSDKYEELLKAADICLALQDPNGRYADLKTPSKFYEFLGYGKAVIATSVGDLALLHPLAARVFPEANSKQIANEIVKLISNPEELADLKENARRYANEHFSLKAVGRRLLLFANRLGNTSD